LLPLAGATLIVLGPVMGFRTGWRRLAAGAPQLRVVTFNVEGGDNPRIAEIPSTLVALGADIMLFQECPEAMVAAGQALGEPWVARRDRSLCLISRYPVDTTRSIGEIETRTAGSTGLVTLYQLRTPSGPLRVGHLHLETPRSGIEVWRGQGETRRLVRNTLLRRGGSARASGWLRDEQADLVGGDFNMPVESWIYRTDWSRCRNGFSRAGTGFGFTRILVRFSARIDHVLACSGWSPVRAFVGPDLGSDHRPMVVDLRRAG
jgi:endonuclease/exonuclease/phosphatase family metal-dependent hydrolase